jgi:class 3 adenylate cyclase
LVGSSSEQAAERTERFLAHAAHVAEREQGRLAERRADQAALLFSRIGAAWRAAIALSYPPPWPAPRSSDRAAIGLEIGDVAQVGDTYVGAPLRLAEAYARLGGPGEILTSAAVAHVVRERNIHIPAVSRGLVQIAGVGDPIEIVELRLPSSAQQPEEE